MSNCRRLSTFRYEKVPDHTAAVVIPEIDLDHKLQPKQQWKKKKKKKKKKSQAEWPTEERQTEQPVIVFSDAGRWTSPADVSCAPSECDSGIALDDDGFGVGFVVEMMDPLDPRVSLPVPERDIAPRDPAHERLSWTVCYDDDCPVHLSEKNGSGWFPGRPGR